MSLSLDNLLYLLIIFSLPTQLGKHFWPDFTTVLGLRIDYLSPTIYLTDLLICFLVFLCRKEITVILHNIFSVKSVVNLSKRYPLLVAGALSVLAGVIFSERPVVGAVGIFRFLEVVFFAWYTMRFLSSVKKLYFAVFVVALALLLQSSIVIIQAYVQHSLGGIWYLFGERTISLSTPGVARAQINGGLYLRPYGTFSHPNTLAGFLLLGSIFVFRQIFILPKKISNLKLLIIFSFLFSIVAMFLTLSRTAIVLALPLAAATAVKGIISWKKYGREIILGLIFFVISIILFFPFFINRFSLESIFGESLMDRITLINASFLMIMAKPFFGVGINEFIVSLPNFLAYLPFSLMQPVHSLFVLFASENGILGFIGLVSVFFFAFRHSINENNWIKIILLGSVIILGLSDHYFLTQQQGRLLIGFVFGYVFSNHVLRTPLKKKYSK